MPSPDKTRRSCIQEKTAGASRLSALTHEDLWWIRSTHVSRFPFCALRDFTVNTKQARKQASILCYKGVKQAQLQKYSC
jgi:hypothetical protein